MTKHSPITSGSLVERAAEIYDFMAFQAPVTEARVLPPALAPAPATRMQAVDLEALRAAGYIVPSAPVSAIAEEFRIVKRHLLLGADATPKDRMILVCSAQPGEGKSFCAVNLALSIASERDVDVLLVDGDFAKPSILSTLGLEGGPGLMDALADPAIDVERLIIRTDVPKLTVLPAGGHSHDDTEHLASARTAAVLASLVDQHPSRIVIFDSPPALAASPASVLALHVGQALMVVRADKTSETELREAIALLGGCDNIQLLLNGVSHAPGGQRFGSYYGYTG